MNEESICRVLIVDDELEYAAQTASKLEEIRPSLLSHNQLQIELTNNAYFAAERLRQCAAGQPPWDIIIAEVYMPFQAACPRRTSSTVTLCRANSDILKNLAMLAIHVQWERCA